MAQKVSVDEMADAIIEGLEEYAELAADEVKKAVRKTGRSVRDQISQTAPRRTAIPGTGTRSPTCWNTGMPRGAAEGSVPFPI